MRFYSKVEKHKINTEKMSNFLWIKTNLSYKFPIFTNILEKA